MWRVGVWVILMCVVWDVEEALACSPQPPDYWFVEIYSVEGSVPDGNKRWIEQIGSLGSLEVQNL